MTPKEKTFKICSRFCRLRDALAYCKRMGIDLSQFNRPEDIIGKCCTCTTVKSWIYMDAGHWIDRGSGGQSGVYFDERNINLQCKSCNAGFYKGKRKPDVKSAYNQFMLDKYGQEVMDELRIRDKLVTRKLSVIILGLHQVYTEEYQKLLDSI